MLKNNQPVQGGKNYLTEQEKILLSSLKSPLIF